MPLNIDYWTLKSTSSNGWEYLFMLRGLGFKSYVCQLCVILIMYYFNNIIERESDNIIIGIIMKSEWIEWLCIDLKLT